MALIHAPTKVVVDCVWQRGFGSTNYHYFAILFYLAENVRERKFDLLTSTSPRETRLNDVIAYSQEPVSWHGTCVAANFAPIDTFGSMDLDTLSFENQSKKLQLLICFLDYLRRKRLMLLKSGMKLFGHRGFYHVQRLIWETGVLSAPKNDGPQW